MTTPTSAAALVEEIDGLMKGATPGPWETDAANLVRGQTSIVQSRADGYHHVATVYPEPAKFAAGEKLAFEPIGYYDARLIVALHNAWPTIRALLIASPE